MRAYFRSALVFESTNAQRCLRVTAHKTDGFGPPPLLKRLPHSMLHCSRKSLTVSQAPALVYVWLPSFVQ
jgi:hypothetical protein